MFTLISRLSLLIMQTHLNYKRCLKARTWVGGGGGSRMFVLCIHVTVQQPQKKPKGSP